MSLVIHTDPLSLPQQDLPDRFQAAIRAADDAQQTHGDDGPYRGSGREPPTWQRDGTVDYIDLDGVRFIPDQVDRRRGMLDTLAGTIALLFALILLAAGLQGGEPRLLPYGIGLGALSAFMFWRGRRTQERAQQEPRLTGLYLFDDALLQRRIQLTPGDRRR